MYTKFYIQEKIITIFFLFPFSSLRKDITKKSLIFLTKFCAYERIPLEKFFFEKCPYEMIYLSLKILCNIFLVIFYIWDVCACFEGKVKCNWCEYFMKNRCYDVWTCQVMQCAKCVKYNINQQIINANEVLILK